MRSKSVVEGGDALTRLTPEQKEIIAILVAAADGKTTEDQCAQVERLVKGNEDMQLFVLRLLNQEAWLSSHGLHESTASVRSELAARIGGLLTAAETCAVSQAVAEQHAIADLFALRPSGPRSRRKSVAESWLGGVSSHSVFGWVVPAAYAALLLGVGVAIGTWANLPSKFQEFPAGNAQNSPNGVPGQGVVATNYEVRLVQNTSCVWGQEMRRRSNDSLGSGDSLNLIHGLAELDLGWSTRGRAKVSLEGPAGMVLMADGGVNLNHGKLTACVALEDGIFAVETPLGRFEVTADASIGVAVLRRSVEIHVYRGDAKVITSWTSDAAWSNNLDVHAGQSMQLATTEAGNLEIARGIAAPDFFVSQLSMTDDLLDISENYVAAIKQTSPVCYWRFNQPVNGFIRNEMADRYHGQVCGNTEWVEELDNWTVKLGTWRISDNVPSHIVADRTLESVGVQSYSLEAWVKPSHFHTATIAALLSPNPDAPGLHGLLLELGGPTSIYVDREHPGRVRFLHRNPPEFSGGNSCFSSVAYGLRKWQHIVVVKDNSEMRLYIDGQQVSKCEDATPLPDGLLLLVGQLDRERNARLFIGQLDELAYYERALSAEEIQQHYRLVRPVRAVMKGI